MDGGSYGSHYVIALRLFPFSSLETYFLKIVSAGVK